MTTTEQSRILIIDDQESIRKSLKLSLEREGYSVETQQKQQEAKEHSEEKFKEFIETRAEEYESRASAKRSSK